MAGDWLKIQTATPDKPEILQMASDLDLDPDAVFGKVFRVWTWFDSHTEDGNAPSVSKLLLERQVGVTGFVSAMISCGWMQEENGMLTIPNFDSHNGQSAKKRANTALRVAKHKKTNTKDNASTNEKVTQGALPNALPREEKRREDKERGKTRSKFKKPSVDEIKEAVKEKGYSVNPVNFFTFYESKDWMIGKNKMKSWEHALANWQSREKPTSKTGVNW